MGRMSRLNSMVAGSGSRAVAGGVACGADADCATCVSAAPSSSPSTPIHADTGALRILVGSVLIVDAFWRVRKIGAPSLRPYTGDWRTRGEYPKTGIAGPPGYSSSA